MENMSKALIIAGAILISLLLVGVGVLVVTRVNAPAQQGVERMNSQEKQSFNSQFEIYQGEQNANNVRSLLSTIRGNNSSDTQLYKVKITYSNGTVNVKAQTDDTSITKVQNDITTAKTYTVTFEYNDGIITDVTIK